MTLVSRATRFEVHWCHFFAKFDWFVTLMSRLLGAYTLRPGVFLWTTTMTIMMTITMTQPITLPLAYACRVKIYLWLGLLLRQQSEEVGHDANLRYSHMNLVCTSCWYTFRRTQFTRVADSRRFVFFCWLSGYHSHTHRPCLYCICMIVHTLCSCMHTLASCM